MQASRLTSLFLLLSVLATGLVVLDSQPSEGAAPADVYNLPQLVAIQNRQYYLNNGLSLQLGYLPSDAFNKGIALGGSYTYYFNDFVGWEIVNANYVINYETNLKHDLEDNFKADIENVGFDGVLDYVDYYASSNLVYTPFYNKSLLFNRTVVRGETSFIAGGGGLHFHSTGWKPMVNVGFLQRYFVSTNHSVFLDVRESVYNEDSRGAQAMLSLFLGYSMQLGSSPASQTPKSEVR